MPSAYLSCERSYRISVSFDMSYGEDASAGIDSDEVGVGELSAAGVLGADPAAEELSLCGVAAAAVGDC